MKAQEFETNKFKCNVCQKQITYHNLSDHKDCLLTAYGYDKELSYEMLLGLCLGNNWIVGTWGQEMPWRYFLNLKDVDGTIWTETPSLLITQYALSVVYKPKEEKPSRPRHSEPVSEPELPTE